MRDVGAATLKEPPAQHGLPALPNHYEGSAFVDAPARVLFDYVDDHERLSSHMSESSWMMGHGRMTTELDAARGRQIGSEIRLSGRILGADLSVAERVTVHDAPSRKVWETTTTPRLLVIGHYRMGFEITPQQSGSLLKVFIDYAFPETFPASLLGRLFGGFYARWCTQQMVRGVARHFSLVETRSR